MNIVENVRKTIDREGLIGEGDNVLLGISGGIDSTTLLFILMEIQKEMPFTIGLAHVNHLLRGIESERDEAFVRELAKRFFLPLHVARLDVGRYASEKGLSIQHAARELRYKAFEEFTNEYRYNRIAVAHNMDDQAETFLLRAVKGTGIRGLSAIPIKRGLVIRPFLNISRAEIAAYAGRHTIPFVEDSSNNKTTYERNYLRKKVLPLLEELNPLFKEKICNLLGDIGHVNGYFEEKARAFLKNCKKGGAEESSFVVEDLQMIDEETRFRVFSHAAFSLDPTFIPLREHIKQIERILFSEKPNLVCILPHDIRARKTYNHLVIEKIPPRQPFLETIILSPGSSVVRPLGIRLLLSHPRKVPAIPPSNRTTAILDADKLGALSLRTFRSGDRFMPLGLRGMVKLKEFFIAAKVPKEERREIPLILSNDDIVWVGGMRIDERFKITKTTRQVLKLQIFPLR